MDTPVRTRWSETFRRNEPIVDTLVIPFPVAQRRFSREWPDFARIPVTEALVSRAETLAWDHRLRGYDAVQLASALTWRDALGRDIVLATFDKQLWEAAPGAGLQA